LRDVEQLARFQIDCLGAIEFGEADALLETGFAFHRCQRVEAQQCLAIQANYRFARTVGRLQIVSIPGELHIVDLDTNRQRDDKVAGHDVEEG